MGSRHELGPSRDVDGLHLPPGGPSRAARLRRRRRRARLRRVRPHAAGAGVHDRDHPAGGSRRRAPRFGVLAQPLLVCRAGRRLRFRGRLVGGCERHARARPGDPGALADDRHGRPPDRAAGGDGAAARLQAARDPDEYLRAPRRGGGDPARARGRGRVGARRPAAGDGARARDADLGNDDVAPSVPLLAEPRA